MKKDNKVIEITCDGSDYVSIDELQPFQGSLKTLHERELVKAKASILDVGFSFPVFVWKNNGAKIIDGHQRIIATKELMREGYSIGNIPIINVYAKDRKEAKKKVLLATSNYGKFDQQGLYELLESENISVDEIEHIISLPDVDLDRFLDNYYREVGHTDDDFIPDDDEVESITHEGDLWLLDDHRLLCGDSTKLAHLERLMDGEKSDMVFTDPPYGMNFEGALGGDGKIKKRRKKIINDALSKDENNRFLDQFIHNIALFNKGAFYISYWRLGIETVMNALSRNKLKWRNLIIWKKNHFNLSNSDYKSQYEPIVYGWSDDYVPILYGWSDKHMFCGKKNESDIWELETVWEIAKTKKNDLHSTMKPVELCMRAIKNSSKSMQIVLDLFGGSGSTLIASHKLHRKCYMMEMSAHYCDVIVKRWEMFTQKKALRYVEKNNC